MDEKSEVLGSQYLTFVLREEHFAVEIFSVREVIDVATLTVIPRMPDYLCGVINLRGNVVPVVDLGLKLGMAPFSRTVNTCIMIVEIEVEERGQVEKMAMGMLTDSVLDVLDIKGEDVENVPRMGTRINTEFIKGMGRHGDKFIILLHIAAILAWEGRAVLHNLDQGVLQQEDVMNAFA